MRENMQDLSEGFPLSKLLKVRDTNKSLILTDEDIDYLLDTKIGKYSFTLLSVIFPAIDLKISFTKIIYSLQANIKIKRI